MKRATKPRRKRQPLRRAEALAILAAHQDDLHGFGVRSLALFGSVARDEARPDSDVDILVEFERPIGYFEFFRLQEHLEALLGCRVDLGTSNALKERVRPRVLQDLVYVT